MSPTTYAVVNLTEDLLWVALAKYLWRVDRGTGSVRVPYLLPGFFVLFALTDFAEVRIQGPLPASLWWTKLLIGSTLFVLANYRDQVGFGTLTRGKLVVRIVAFVALVWLYLEATS